MFGVRVQMFEADEGIEQELRMSLLYKGQHGVVGD